MEPGHSSPSAFRGDKTIKQRPGFMRRSSLEARMLSHAVMLSKVTADPRNNDHPPLDSAEE